MCFPCARLGFSQAGGGELRVRGGVASPGGGLLQRGRARGVCVFVCGTLLALSISWLFPSPTHVFTRVAHEGAVQSSSSADAVSPRGWCSLASSPRQVPEERFLAGLCGYPTCTNPAPQYAPARTFSLPPTSVGRFGVSERRIVHHPPWRDLWPFLLGPGPTRYECGRSELVPLSLHSGFAVSVLGGAHGVRVRAWGRSHAITDSELGGSFHMCMNHQQRLCVTYPSNPHSDLRWERRLTAPSDG